MARCSIPPKQRTWDTREIRSYRDLQLTLQGAGARGVRLTRKVLNWLMDAGWLLEYRLARKLDLEIGVG